MQIRVCHSAEEGTLTIPRSVAEAAHMAAGSLVEVSLQDGKLVVAPTARRMPTLEELVAGITDENRHEEVETGPPVGEELW